MRSSTPVRGRLECRAWETYYRRKWGAFPDASIGLVRAAFRMGWRDTLAARGWCCAPIRSGRRFRTRPGCAARS